MLLQSRHADTLLSNVPVTRCLPCVRSLPAVAGGLGGETSGERRAASDEPRATSDERPAANPGRRFPAVGRRLAFWQFPRPAACPPLAGPSVAQSLSPFSSTFFPHWHGSCAQRRMAMSPCCKPSNSSQNRSKRRRFPSKSDQKGAHFVMPILTFWGVTPSGASARAVLAFRKGKKARFGGAKWRPEKLSTISTSAQLGAAGQSLPARPVESSTCGGQPPRHHAWGAGGAMHTGDTQDV